MKKILIAILYIIISIIFITTLAKFIQKSYIDKAEDYIIEKINQKKPDITNIKDGDSKSFNESEIQDEFTSNEYPLMDFSDLRKISSEVIAWITLDDTEIDYPVVQTSDNNFYLYHDADKQKNRNGAIFLDYRNTMDFTDLNNIVYGHNMKSGKMFAGINLYKDRDYFDSHESGWLYTSDKTYRLEILEVAVVPSIGNAYTWTFDSKSAWDAYLDQLMKDAKFIRETSLAWGDKLLTLSTCSYEFKDARTILIAKMIG